MFSVRGRNERKMEGERKARMEGGREGGRKKKTKGREGAREVGEGGREEKKTRKKPAEIFIVSWGTSDKRRNFKNLKTESSLCLRP